MPDPEKTQKSPIRCGIIGYGKMGRIRAEAIRESGKGVVQGIYDPVNPAPAGIRAYPDETALIEDPAIDAVFVCTPNYRIPDLCKQALSAGKHVFAEKPPAFNAAQLEEVIAVEKQAGKVLMYGFNHRHHASIQKMKQVVDSGELGKILWMRGRYGKEVDEAYFKGWRANPELAGGGILLDQGIHMLDLFLYFGGPFDEIHALVSNLFWKTPGLEDNVFAIMKNSQTGVCASLHSTMTQWRYLFSLEIFLEGGALILNGLKTSSGAYGDENLAIKRNTRNPEQGQFDQEEHLVYKTNISWGSEVELFFDSLAANTILLLGSSACALSLMNTIDKIYDRGQA